jgi:hypothetical protein
MKRKPESGFKPSRCSSLVCANLCESVDKALLGFGVAGERGEEKTA